MVGGVSDILLNTGIGTWMALSGCPQLGQQEGEAEGKTWTTFQKNVKEGILQLD